MLRVIVVVIAAFVAICFASSPLYETEHYKIYSLESERSAASDGINKERQFQEEVNGDLRTIVERPSTSTDIPEDDGSPLFGDIKFAGLRRDGELIIRDTIVNDIIDENVYIFYNRSLPGYYVEDMRIYNVGRQRGWVYRAVILHNIGYVETQVLISAGNTVRIFVEIYVRVEESEKMNGIGYFPDSLLKA